MNHTTQAKKDILDEILFEALRARGTWPPYNSYHEGYAVLKEEIEELWDAVKRKPRDHNHIREEAIQVGAVILLFITDLCNPDHTST